MPERTNRSTGSRNVLERVKGFISRKAKNNGTLNLNSGRTLRDMTEDELVVMMEAAFGEPAFTNDNDRIEFFMSALTRYELDMSELENEINNTTDETKKQELEEALNGIRETYARLSNAIVTYKKKHRTFDEEVALSEIRDLVSKAAEYYKEFLAAIDKTNEAFETSKLSNRAEVEACIKSLTDVGNKITPVEKELGAKVSSYTAKFGTIETTELRQNVITEDQLEAQYERTFRNFTKCANEEQKAAFRLMLGSIQNLYSRFFGRKKAVDQLSAIEQRVNDELKRGKPSPVQPTQQPDQPNNGQPQRTPGGSGSGAGQPTQPNPQRTQGQQPGQQPAQPGNQNGNQPDQPGQQPGQQPVPPVPPVQPSDGRQPGQQNNPGNGQPTQPAPQTPPVDPTTHGTPNDSSDEYNKLKSEYIATILEIKNIVQALEQVNAQEESFIVNKLYTDKDQIVTLIGLERQAKLYQDRIFELKIKLSDIDYDYFMKTNKIISLDPEIARLDIKNAEYPGQLDDFVNAHNEVIAEKYQEIVATNAKYKAATTQKEKDALVEKVNKKLEFITYIKSMISRRLLAERLKNPTFDIIGYMKNHMVPVPDGFTRTDAPQQPTQQPDGPDQNRPGPKPGSGSGDGGKPKPKPKPGNQPQQPTGPDRQQPGDGQKPGKPGQQPGDGQQPAPSKPTKPGNGNPPDGPGNGQKPQKPEPKPISAATIIGMKLEIRQVQKIQRDKAIVVEGLYEVKALKDKLRIIFKKELVEQLKALKAKINIEAHTKDGRKVDARRINGNTWDIENPDEIMTTSIDIVPPEEVEQHTMGK